MEFGFRPRAVRDSRLRARCTAQRRDCSNSGNYCDIAFTDERQQYIQWRTQEYDVIFGGINLTKVQPDIAYDMSRKIVVKSLYNRAINCTVARLQSHTDVF